MTSYQPGFVFVDEKTNLEGGSQNNQWPKTVFASFKEHSLSECLYRTFLT